MTIKFYNTLTRKIDEFVSIKPNKVSVYTCGPTVYDHPHIGNWAAYIYWDILVRVLMANDYEVTRVMNITDVGHLVSDGDEGEDKLEKGARREGKTAWEVAQKYTDIFIKEMGELNIIKPTYIAKATDYIDEQLDLIRKLKTKGVTYQIDDGIYFDTSKFPRYADFARLDIESLKAGARIEYNLQKRNPSDFALWKFTPIGQKRDMEWITPNDLLENSSDSNPVMGFPGWHIECSAMSLSLLGETIDIHTGGIDHIPVHHTNEIAQSETATGVKFSNYWLHCNFMKVDGKKFSKSLGNGYTLDDLKEKGFSPADFRMFLLQGHYRNEGNFTFENLQAAKNRLHNWRNFAALRHQIHATVIDDNEKNSVSFKDAINKLYEAINDDLGTPKVLFVVDETITNVKNIRLNNINKQSFTDFIDTIDSLLGLNLITSTPDISDEAKSLIIERINAREQKDWHKSDKLRDRLSKINVVIRDVNPETSVWEYKS